MYDMTTARLNPLWTCYIRFSVCHKSVIVMSDFQHVLSNQPIMYTSLTYFEYTLTFFAYFYDDTN